MHHYGRFGFSINSKEERKFSFSSVVIGTLSSAILLLPTSLLAQQCDVAADPSCHCQANIIGFPNNAINVGEGGKLPVLLEADQVEADGEDSVTLSGGAYVAQGRQSISGGVITYSRETDQISAVGGVQLRSVAGDSITADSVSLDVNQKLGVAQNAKFKIAERGEIAPETNAVRVQARGDAQEIALEGEQFIRMKNVKYTTCTEGQDDFFVRANELDIDQSTGMAIAKGASVVFKGVPLLYVPAMSFSVDGRRKSGFLFPKFGSDSDSGFVFEAPWYWNIAPSVDATVTPRLYTDRGIQLGFELRHKTDDGDTLFYAEHMPSDDLEGDDTRSMFSLRHDSKVSDNLSLDVDFNDVSDKKYFQDFSTEVDQFSAVYVPRKAALRYSEEYWNASVAYSDYKIVDEATNVSNKPFEKLPEIAFSTNLPKTGMMQFDVEGSATNFAHEAEGKDEGWRYVLKPKVSIPMEEIWGYVTPALQINNTSYNIDGRNVDGRTTPIVTVDSGLYLEKNTSFYGEKVTQTLEPRLMFSSASVDEVTEENEVDFDTQSVRFNSFNSLYNVTGFTGDDQIADGSQVALALSTRMYNDEGEQRLKASIGQAFYSEDREIEVRNDDGKFEKVKSNESDILALFHMIQQAVQCELVT